jgi:TolA-binding protein
MNPDFLVPLAGIAIIMAGLVKIARHWSLGVQARKGGAVNQLQERVDAMEQDIATLQHDLVEAHERLDFAERLLSQSREGKRLESSP